MTINLTDDQKSALEKFELFLGTDETVFLLKGAAGTGKTWSTSYIIHNLLPRYQMRVVGISPTHKAKRVLRQRMPACQVLTLASLLLKLRKHTTLGARAFDEGSDIKAREFTKTCFILDEVSMVSDSDFYILERAARANSNKILAIGDPYQIPAIAQSMRLESVDSRQVLRRRQCAVFIKPYSSAELTQIVRQVVESPILRVATFVRDHIHDDFSLKKLFPEMVVESSAAYSYFESTVSKGTKIIAYTNEAVDRHNKAVRAALGRETTFVVGELLMGYQNIGYPQLFIENGADYEVTRVIEEKNGLFKGMIGWTVTIVDLDDYKQGSLSLFFPAVGVAQNRATFARLVELARKVNAARSTKRDYAMYRALKDKLFFLQNLYEFPVGSETFYTESQLKLKEPLLFSMVSDVVEEKELYENLKMLYGDLIDARLKDDKVVADQETFASAFCVLEKDLDYGYSQTCHKAQSSTLDTVFVDEDNFQRLRDRWNPRYGQIEDKLTERNQLLYVACTRPSNKLYLY